LTAHIDFITQNISRVGWFIGRADAAMNDQEFSSAIRKALLDYRKELDKEKVETPYGIPYRPKIWGAGWDIQSFGFSQYFLVTRPKAIKRLFQSGPHILRGLIYFLKQHLLALTRKLA